MKKSNDTKEILLKDFLAFKFASSRDIDKLITRFERLIATQRIPDDELILPMLATKTIKADNERQPVEECSRIAAPIFENLENATEWRYIPLCSLAMVIGHHASYNTAMERMQEALDVILDDHSEDPKYMRLCTVFHINILVRMIRTKYLEPNIDMAALEKAFKRSYDYAMEVCVRNDAPLQYVLQARLGIFEGNVELVKTNLATLKELGEKKMYKTTKDELGDYIRFMGSKLDTPLQNFFSGYNARNERIRQKRRVSEVAAKLDMDDNVLNAIERGDGGMSIVTLKDLATTLNVSSDYLLYGIGDNGVCPHIHNMEKLMRKLPSNKRESLMKMAQLFYEENK